MATFEEVEAAKPKAFAWFEERGIDVAIGVGSAGVWTRLRHPSMWRDSLPFLVRGEDVSRDCVLAIRLQAEEAMAFPSHKLPRSIDGVPAEYESIGIIQAY